MRAAILAVIVAIVAVVSGCDRESKSGSASSGSIVYRSPDGRVISQEELKNVSGTFNHEIVGGEDVPAAARQLHERARAAGGRGEYDNTIALLQSASKAAPQWPYPVYDLAYTY